MSWRGAQRRGHPSGILAGLPRPPSRARNDKPDEFISRCVKRAVAIQLDCFVATLLAMTVCFSSCVAVSHRTLTVLTPCFNEVANVGVLTERVAAALVVVQSVDYRHVFIDNVSTNGTQEELRKLVCGLKVGRLSQYTRLNGARRRRPRRSGPIFRDGRAVASPGRGSAIGHAWNLAAVCLIAPGRINPQCVALAKP